MYYYYVLQALLLRITCIIIMYYMYYYNELHLLCIDNSVFCIPRFHQTKHTLDRQIINCVFQGWLSDVKKLKQKIYIHLFFQYFSSVNINILLGKNLIKMIENDNEKE